MPLATTVRRFRRHHRSVRQRGARSHRRAIAVARTHPVRTHQSAISPEDGGARTYAPRSPGRRHLERGHGGARRGAARRGRREEQHAAPHETDGPGCEEHRRRKSVASGLVGEPQPLGVAARRVGAVVAERLVVGTLGEHTEYGARRDARQAHAARRRPRRLGPSRWWSTARGGGPSPRRGNSPGPRARRRRARLPSGARPPGTPRAPGCSGPRARRAP